MKAFKWEIFHPFSFFFLSVNLCFSISHVEQSSSTSRQFHQRKTRAFFIRTSFQQLFLVTWTCRNVHSYKKICTLNVDENDYSCQFHQHFTLKFFVQNKLSSFSLVTFWLWQKDFGKKALLYKKMCVWNVDEIDSSHDKSKMAFVRWN